MGALTEPEIFDCMADNIRSAIDCCEIMARRPLRGLAYRALVGHLKKIEGCCKQACVWREDARWLPIAEKIEEAHKRAGSWLRGFRMPDGTRVKLAEGTLHPCFIKLAENLRALLKLAQETRDKATNRIGMILPQPQRGPHRDTVPVGWRRTDAGLVVPQAVMAQ
jgi:hypothetical protein